MAIAFGDVIKAVVSFNMPDNTIAQNVFYYEASTGVNASDPNVTADVGAALEAAYGQIDQIMASSVSGNEIVVYKRDSATGDYDQIGVYDFTGFVGTGGTEMLPHGAAALVRFPGDGTPTRKRTFVPGLIEGISSASSIGPNSITALTAFATAILADIATDGGDMEGGWYSIAKDAFFEFAGQALVNGIIAYQRRRKPGVGI